jgi:hypothetical protein
MPKKTTNCTPPLPQGGFDIKTSARAEALGKKRHCCRQLPKQFQRDGFDYRQICRDGDFAIYRQTWMGNEHSAAFEVIRIRRRADFRSTEDL